MSDTQKVTDAAGLVGIATLLSRILGYARDVSIATVFGAGPISDAFIAAFRIPNMVRRLFGEGTLSISVVPVVSEYLHTDGRRAVMQITFSGIRLLSAALAVVGVIGVLASPWIASAVAYGFKSAPDKFALTVDLTRIMFPYVALIGTVAFLMGVLNALGHFAAPALAPVMLNLSMIGALWVVTAVTPHPFDRAVGLAVGVLVGGVLQLALQIPFLIKTGGKLRDKTPWLHPGLKKIGKLFIPATFGAAVLQVNTIVINLLASFQSDGSVTYLYFADRLVQFPLGIFGIAIATAILPVCSRQAAAADMGAFRETFTYGLRLVWFFTLPAMVGLTLLRVPIVALLFQHGSFDSVATRLTAHALLYYTGGLWAFAAVRIVVAAFYAMQDTATPVRIATVAIIVNAALGWMLMGTMNHAGLALAVSLSSILNLTVLAAVLQRRTGAIVWRSLLPSVFKTICGSALMGMVVWAAVWLSGPQAGSGALVTAGRLIAHIGLGILCYVAFAHWAKCPELQAVRAIFHRRKTFP